jgi:glutamate---cysteine ligase / carboxylate-amine ligase
MGAELTSLPAWAEWAPNKTAGAFTVGVEEEFMLLDARTGDLEHGIERLLSHLSGDLEGHVTPETHAAAAELSTAIHDSAPSAISELRDLRHRVRHAAKAADMGVASAGTHPFAVWQTTAVSPQPRYQLLHDVLRELARREPTFALHVHVGLPDPEAAIEAVNRLRAHLPLLLALSANSPFSQGRDTGLASARTPLFQAFPRVGIPRRFDDYRDYVAAVDQLLRLGAFPEPTFLWWDVRPQPALGTVEVRIMDAQTTLHGTSALVALVQCIVALELHEGFSLQDAATPEILIENRFLAARDGVEAELLDPVREQRVPVAQLASELVDACAPHARILGCSDELLAVHELLSTPSAARQRSLAQGPQHLRGLVAALSANYVR